MSKSIKVVTMLDLHGELGRSLSGDCIVNDVRRV